MDVREILERLIAFDTVSHRPNRALMDWVAGLLAQAGVEVLLVDQQPPGRDKVCGDGLIPDAHAALAHPLPVVAQSASTAASGLAVTPAVQTSVEVGTLQMQSAPIARDFTSRNAASVSAVSPDCEITTTSAFGFTAGSR